MSATLYFQPVKGKALRIGAPSSFMSALDRAFKYSQPWTIEASSHDIAILEGLRAGLDDLEQRAAINELLKALEDHTDIRVWAEY